MPKILLIDDDEKLAGLLGNYFQRFDLDLLSALRPSVGLEMLNKDQPDLVILDVMLPEQDGFEVCRTIRKTSVVPIIMLTARGEVTDRIVGLEIGADDYLPKPFEPRELVVRIQNVLRRAVPAEAESDELKFKGLILNPERRTIELDGSPLELTTMEFELLALFAQNSGKALSRDEILNGLRGIDAQIFSRSVDILVSRLRQKLGDTAKRPRFIKTVWGRGYTFVAEEAVVE
ncbi:MAG: response regulator transcription factor [Gammaproteobacteria bacterium]|jgi:OmpR family response regulator RpaB|nr:response regulator transcription factor [Gammaproteobacteria bacterium]MDP7154130.1 response regulator transcription factor [Gammaproteobacteria bacterium]MDP7419555.1 response regulator transcription factor [Gammaproteobacteria bacterium]MDP7659583.1 response regulator transcription factor [Gammaproteobacteria bacterium]HJP37649.1 response regulator transcription factor [Gammaproteobacteria bacterium]